MVWIKELQITTCSMLKCPVNLKFNEGTNYLLGVNGSGKTTLMQVIQGIFNFDFSNLISQSKELELHTVIVNNSYTFEIDITRNQGKQLDSALMAQSVKHAMMTTESVESVLTVTSQDLSGNIVKFVVTGSQVEIVLPQIGKSIIKSFPSVVDSMIFHLAFYEAKEMIYEFVPDHSFDDLLRNLPFDEPLSLFTEGLTDNERFVEEELHRIIVFSKNQNFQTLSKLLSKQNIQTKLGETIDVESLPEDFSVSILDVNNLENVATAINSTSVTFTFNVESTSKLSDVTAINIKLSRISIILNNGDKIPYKELSYGQKRYLMIMLYLANSQTCRLLDEPVNGLHHSLIDDVMNRVTNAGIQTFITNQNPALFDCIEFSSREDFQSRVVLCTLENDKMSWNNPSDEFADKFYEDYENNFLNVSSILKFNQIW